MLLADEAIAVWVTGSVAIVVSIIGNILAAGVAVYIAKSADRRQDLERATKDAERHAQVDEQIRTLQRDIGDVKDVPSDMRGVEATLQGMAQSMNDFHQRMEKNVGELFSLLRNPLPHQCQQTAKISEIETNQKATMQRVTRVEDSLRRCAQCREAEAGV